MNASAPHYLLFSESTKGDQRDPRGGLENAGRWRFVLEKVDGSTRFEADDEESETDDSRLELLAVVRGLEALNEPSRVTLVTPSRYVSRGFRYGLEQWRENRWCWERFGEMTPVRNRDLWQRVDRAMKYHRVDCRVWRFDFPESCVPSPRSAPARKTRKNPRRRTRPKRKATIFSLPFRMLRALSQGCLAFLPRSRNTCKIGLGME
jgi:ribonuclease HI